MVNFYTFTLFYYFVIKNLTIHFKLFSSLISSFFSSFFLNILKFLLLMSFPFFFMKFKFHFISLSRLGEVDESMKSAQSLLAEQNTKVRISLTFFPSLKILFLFSFFFCFLPFSLDIFFIIFFFL